MSKHVPVHFGGFGRRPEPTSVGAQVARRLGLSSHTPVTSPRGDLKSAVSRCLSDMDALAEGETAEFAMLAPGDLVKQTIDALAALGADYEPEELSAALMPALCALGRCHAGADDDDDDTAAHDDESTPAARRAKYATREQHVDLDQEEMARRCIPEGMSGHVVSHIRTR